MYELNRKVVVSRLHDRSDEERAVFLDMCGEITDRWSGFDRTVYELTFPDGRKEDFYHWEVDLLK